MSSSHMHFSRHGRGAGPLAPGFPCFHCAGVHEPDGWSWAIQVALNQSAWCFVAELIEFSHRVCIRGVQSVHGKASRRCIKAALQKTRKLPLLQLAMHSCLGLCGALAALNFLCTCVMALSKDINLWAASAYACSCSTTIIVIPGNESASSSSSCHCSAPCSSSPNSRPPHPLPLLPSHPHPDSLPGPLDLPDHPLPCP